MSSALEARRRETHLNHGVLRSMIPHCVNRVLRHCSMAYLCHPVVPMQRHTIVATFDGASLDTLHYIVSSVTYLGLMVRTS